MSILETNNNVCAVPPGEDSSPSTSSIRFVLVETSRPGNIGAAARAMKTMGYHQLVLVRPRSAAPAQEEEAIAFASGALDVLEGAQIVDSIEQALQGCHYVGAVSARLREFSPPLLTPRAWAARLADGPFSAHTRRAALIFGNERFGLPNAIVEKCDALINIPANPAYSSLNLAQAVQILAYECALADRSAVEEGPAQNASLEIPIAAQVPGRVGFLGETAEKTQVDAMFGHLEQALVAIDFLDPEHPKRLMSRLRRLFARTGLETEEVNIFRGIAGHILKSRK